MNGKRPVSFAHAWGKAVRLTDQPTAAKCLAHSLRLYMNANGWGYVSTEKLARDISASEDTVKRARRSLKEARLLQVVEGGGRVPGGNGKVNEYQALIPVHLCTRLEGEGVHWCRDTGALMPRYPGTGAPPRSNEVGKKKEAARELDSSPLPVPIEHIGVVDPVNDGVRPRLAVILDGS